MEATKCIVGFSLSSFIKQKKGSKSKGIFMGFVFYHFYGFFVLSFLLDFVIMLLFMGFVFYHFYWVLCGRRGARRVW